MVNAFTSRAESVRMETASAIHWLLLAFTSLTLLLKFVVLAPVLLALLLSPALGIVRRLRNSSAMNRFASLQFGVDGRKTLFLLLLLFAIPADAVSAQTPPPPLDEQALERAPATVVKRLATRFSLGAFVGRFEETRLDAVREAVGEGTIQHQGDAAGSIHWLCYRRAQHRLWVLSGEIGGPDHLVTEIVEELAENDAGAATDCAILPEKFSPVVFDGKLHLGMARQEVITALGPPSKSEAARIVYSHAGKLPDGFDETAWLILGFREGKLVSMRGGKTTTN